MDNLAETAFAPHLQMLGPASGQQRLLLSERSRLGIATVMARAGHTDALLSQVAAELGITGVDAPMRAATGESAMIGVGPGAWLFTREAASPEWAAELAERFSGLASVFDQSSGYAALRIDGPDAAAVIGKGAFIDLDPAAFPPGSAAVTVIAHIGAILWRLGETSFEIAVFRSFAASFWHWLTTAAIASGIEPQRIDENHLSPLSRGDENAQ